MEYVVKYDCAKDKVKQHFNCIYYYKNKANGKGYVGQTVNFINRFRGHKTPSSNKYPIDIAITKYGIENFLVYILIENVEDIEELNALEKHYISKFGTVNRDVGYNIREGGNNSPMAESSKKKLSESRIGIKLSSEHKQKISESMTKEKNPFYGKKHSEETKRKMSNSLKQKYSAEKHPRKGMKTSDETKKKLSESRKGKYTGKNNPSARAVKCIETNEVFHTIKEATDWCGASRASIIQSIKKGCVGGKHPLTKEKLHWEYVY